MTFAQPTVVYDRTGTVELGRFQRESTASCRVRRRARAGARRDDDRRGPDVLGEQRLRRAGDHVGPRRGRQRSPRAGRLDDHPAARPGAAPARRRDRGRRGRYLRKAKEIIQSMRLSDSFPGEAGKDRVITAYLNEIFYGHGAYGVAAAAQIYFGVDRPGQADPRAGGAAGGPPEVAVDPRPVPLRREGREGPAGRAGRFTARRPARLDPRRAGRGRARWTTPDPDPDRGGQGRAGRPRRRPAARVQGGPLHLAGPPSARCRSWATRPTGRDRRLHGHHDPRLEGPAARREVARGRRRSCPTCRARRATRSSRRSGSPRAIGPGSGRCAARTSTTARWSPSTTGAATSSPTPAARATTGAT